MNVTIYLYPVPTPNDVILRDPTAAPGGSPVTPTRMMMGVGT